MKCEEVRRAMTSGEGPFSATRGERGAVFDHLAGCPECERWASGLTGIPLNTTDEEADAIIAGLIASGRITREQLDGIHEMILKDVRDPEFRRR